MNNGKLRIYELSNELNLNNQEVLAICDQLNIAVKSHNSSITKSDAERIRIAANKLPNNGAISHKANSIKTNFRNNRPAARNVQQNLQIRNLRIWEVFLQVEESIARKSQFCVRFVAHNYGGTRRISFEIDLASATLDGGYENFLDAENFWERAKQARNEEIKLFDTVPTGKNWRNSRQLGSIEQVDPKGCIISVRLERDLADYMATKRYQLPASGFLFFEAVGEIHQIQRKKKALDDLKNGRSQNPYLGNFLFDASQARPIQKTVEIKPDNLLLSSANPNQKAAVEKVLAAEDIVFIQGPPGTGKTTVIAEICYQVALRGGRTLIASQANLAVDNVLSRLVHNPAIRAVRKGRAERVGEEGQPFLEDRVIGTWLENTANDCENSLGKRIDNLQVLPQLLASSERFTAYLKAEEELNQKQNKFQKDKANLEADWKKQETAYKVLIAQKNEVKFLINGLDNLLDTAPNVNWQTPEITSFLPRLKPYTEGNSLVKNFLANVRTAIKYTDEFGFIRPEHGAFGLAVWLREIATEISQIRIAFSDAKDASAAISEVADSVQVFQHNSNYLNQLETDYQQFITNQQSLQPKIANWENRKREIDLVITAVKEWKSRAYSRLYEILENFPYSQVLTNEEVQLPSGLLKLANSSNLPLIPPNYKLNLPDFELLTRAMAYEIEGGFIDKRGKQYNFSYFLQQSFSQIPMVLSTSERTQWQEIYQQFHNYQQLNQNQRQILVKNTQQYLNKIQVYAESIDTRNRITQELLESILTNARQCVIKVKTEIEQQLQSLQKQLNELQKNQITQQQISIAQNQVEIARQDANLKLERVINILQSLTQPNVPAQLRILAEQYLTTQANIWEQPQQFSTQVHNWESHTSQLESLILSLEPFTVLKSIKNSLDLEFRLKNQ